MAEKEKNAFVKQVAEQKYEFGFTTNVDTEIIDKGLNEDVVRLISRKKGEPDWLLDFRLSLLADIGATQLGTCQAAPDRLSRHFLLCGSLGQETAKQGDGP